MNTTTTKSRVMIFGASALCALGIAGAIGLTLAGSASAHKATPAPVPSGSHSTAPSGHHVTPPVAPSASVETMQRELGQLNYYEGPINGYLTPQTVNAIEYLQRDADLPQTGHFDQVTYLALQRMLATGNNQMAG